MSFQSAELQAWKRQQRAKRTAPPPFTFTEMFCRYTPPGNILKTHKHVDLVHLLAVPDLWAHAEHSGSEACYIEVARWSCLRERWERFAFAKCFGGEIPEHPHLGDNETCRLVAGFINERQHSTFSKVIHNFPAFNEPQPA